MSEKLNVDVLASFLATMYPEINRAEFEDYDSLLEELNGVGITTVDELPLPLKKRHGNVMAVDKKYAARMDGTPRLTDAERNRIRAGAYFSHVGLAREALRQEFGRIFDGTDPEGGSKAHPRLWPRK